MFSLNTCLFVLALTVACNAVVSAKEPIVELGGAEEYVILANTGISTVPDSVITGNIAVSPITSAAMTGFSLSMDLSGRFSTSTQLIGKAYAANYSPTILTRLNTAANNMGTAYTDAAGRSNSDAARINLGGGILGGAFGGATTKLTPGVYTFGSSVVLTSDIYFEGSGIDAGQGDTDVFIIQISGVLTQAANYNVFLSNGALAKNIFWQVAGNVALGAGAHMEGILLVKTDVLFVTGSSLNGRVFAQTACNLQSATITETSSESIQSLVSIQPSVSILPSVSIQPSISPSVSILPSVSI